MFLKQNSVILRPPSLNPGDGSLIGKTVKLNIDRTWPLEHIIIRVCFTTGGTAFTLFPATAQTNDNYDNILNFVKHINLSVNPGNGGNPRTVVDCDGVRLLEYNSLTGLNLDPSTLELLRLSQGTTLAANSSWEITYNIPCAETMIGEPLRSRLLLPVHKYTQDPVLTIQFQTLAAMASAGTTPPFISCEVELVRRQVTAESELVLKNSAPSTPWGYIDWDLIEQQFPVQSLTSEQKFPLALGAAYANLLISQYQGGANITKNVIDSSGIGDTTAHGLGAESLWRLETALVPDRFWTSKGLRNKAAWSQVKNVLSQTSSPSFGGPVLGSTNFTAPSVGLIDFLRDGISGDPATELGSVLDCNLTGSLRKEIIVACATWATNASTLAVMGRRLFGDLSQWQKIS